MTRPLAAKQAKVTISVDFGDLTPEVARALVPVLRELLRRVERRGKGE